MAAGADLDRRSAAFPPEALATIVRIVGLAKPEQRDKLLAIFLAMGLENWQELHGKLGQFLRGDEDAEKPAPAMRMALDGVDPRPSLGEAREILERHSIPWSPTYYVPTVTASTAPARSRARASHGAKPGHRRATSTRAGPDGDDGPAEPSARRSGVYTFGVEARERWGLE